MTSTSRPLDTRPQSSRGEPHLVTRSLPLKALVVAVFALYRKCAMIIVVKCSGKNIIVALLESTACGRLHQE